MSILILSDIHFTFSSLFTQQCELKNFVLLKMWSHSWESVISEDLCVLLANENNCEGFHGCEMKYKSWFLRKKRLINLYNGVLSSMTSVSWLILLPALLLAFCGGTDELDAKKKKKWSEGWLLNPPGNLLEKLSLGLILLADSNAAKWGPRDVFTFFDFQVTKL